MNCTYPYHHMYSSAGWLCPSCTGGRTAPGPSSAGPSTKNKRPSASLAKLFQAAADLLAALGGAIWQGVRL